MCRGEDARMVFAAESDSATPSADQGHNAATKAQFQLRNNYKQATRYRLLMAHDMYAFIASQKHGIKVRKQPVPMVRILLSTFQTFPHASIPYYSCVHLSMGGTFEVVVC